MDRRLSNVQIQQQMRRESYYRDSSPLVQIDPRQGRGVVKQQPRGYSRNFPGFTDSYWRGQAANQKRRRPTLWETLAGLVCSLGALASRAAKMAARRSDML
ncbi:hypothetical protein KQX54_020787 [Cotesia glomerata]|uniref:Uncharacterized protein n=1 Tax=Cotesia glomerata TaxID=32391 RepID=A0AAV7IUX1_COTGL|nr:hypothetical protein KQX54_020787 [Cotesia glomerata]